MKLSTRARYGLRALIFLAQQEPGMTVSVREIARNEDISEDYLEHLLYAMKQAGLVESTRGAAGGFMLAAAARDITLKDVFEALGEGIEPVWCLQDGETCPRSKTCASRPVWNEFGRLVDGFLSAKSLAEVAAGRK